MDYAVEGNSGGVGCLPEPHLVVERRSGVDRRRGGDRRASMDMARELGRPPMIDLRRGSDRRSGVERRRECTLARRPHGDYVTPWQLPD